ncbi:MAG: hypothetical protein KDA91_11160, partial [Planctomycetaceae bacterium]|nr:hypothetical protein [Planctomycetaceae bacterium]
QQPPTFGLRNYTISISPLRLAQGSIMAKKKAKSSPNKKQRLRILVSSTVYGYEELLESTYALLDSYGYEVLMSHNGTLPVDPFLWKELREHFLKTALPDTSEEFVQLVASKIEDLIGSDLRRGQPIFVERYDSGGMSSGHVCPETCDQMAKAIRSGQPCQTRLTLSRGHRPTKAASSSTSTDGPLTSIPSTCIRHEKWRKSHEKVIL